MTTPRLITSAERLARKLQQPIGLGAAITMVTSAAGIKPCPKCKKRGTDYDKRFPNINPFST